MDEFGEKTGVFVNMVVLAQARRDGGEVASLQVGADFQWSSGALKVLSLPDFVPKGDVAAITVCAHAVASGEYTGVEFAEILQRAEVRCEIASVVKSTIESAAEAAVVYAAAVSNVDAELGYGKRKFVAEVANLAVVIGISSRMSGLGRVDELDAVVRSALDLKVVGDNVVVATPSVVDRVGESKPVHDDYRVVPISIYRALMKLSAKVIGSSVFVSVSRSADGVYRLETEFDCSNCYSVASLPHGRYSLPGGFGRLVSARFLCGVLESVVALPNLRSTNGFCYMGTLPPSLRLKAAAVLGRDPSVMNLVNLFPEAYDWCGVEAVVRKTGSVGDEFVYHVEEGGTLPINLPRLARIGMVDKYASELSEHTDKLLNDIFNNVVSADSGNFVAGSNSRLRAGTQGDSRERFQNSGDLAVPRSMPGTMSSVAVSRSVSPLPVVGYGGSPGLIPPVRGLNHMRSHSDSGLTMSNRVVLDMGTSSAFKPVWQDVENPRARMWVTRLGEGAPIPTRELQDLARVRSVRDLPVPPASVSGTSVMVRPDSALRTGDGKMISWERRPLLISGCSMEYAKLSSHKGKRFLAVHPMKGVICRYDLDFDHSVVVNGGLNVSSVGCVLWMHGDASFHVVGIGTIVRTWFDDGMPGLGAMVSSMVFTFTSTAIRMYGGEIQADRVVGLELKSVDTRAGLVRFHKKFRMKPSVEKVHLYAFDDVLAEPVLLVLQARGLRYVVVHGTRIPADSCQVSVVVLDAQTTVKICVDADGESTGVDAQMLFVRESRRYADCVGHNVAVAGSGDPQRTLFIADK